VDKLLATTLKALLRKDFWEEYSDQLSDEIVTNNLVRTMLGVYRNCHSLTSGDVTLTDVSVHVEAHYEDERKEELLTLIEELEGVESGADSVLRDSLSKYVATECARQATLYMAARVGTEQLDMAIPAELVQRAMDAGEGIHAQVLDLDDAGLPGETDIRTNVSPLRLSPRLDSVLDGGVGGGELIVFLAPPCRGKTSYLCAVGARAAQAGRNVLHVTLEISKRRVARRYDTVLTNLNREEILKAPGQVVLARKKMKGCVKIKDWSYQATTPSDVKHLVKRLRAQGTDIDMVVVDYLELLEPNRRNGKWEQRHAYGQLGKDMRAAAVALDVPVVTAWQVNREGTNLDSVGLHHVSESWEIIKHADAIIGMNQNPEELRNKTMRLAVLKQREGTDRPEVYLHSDLDRCVIYDKNYGPETLNDKNISLGGGSGGTGDDDLVVLGGTDSTLPPA